MIDANGNLRCKYCGHKHGLKLIGFFEWYCPKCHKYQVDDTNELPLKNLTFSVDYVKG